MNYIISITGESSNALDSIIQDACGVLFNFIKTNPAAWAPIISSVSHLFMSLEVWILKYLLVLFIVGGANRLF